MSFEKFDAFGVFAPNPHVIWSDCPNTSSKIYIILSDCFSIESLVLYFEDKEDKTHWSTHHGKNFYAYITIKLCSINKNHDSVMLFCFYSQNLRIKTTLSLVSWKHRNAAVFDGALLPCNMSCIGLQAKDDHGRWPGFWKETWTGSFGRFIGGAWVSNVSWCTVGGCGWV